MTTRAISWAAVSSKPQAERESLADQHHLNHQLAEVLGWEIIADVTVPGQSRSYYRLSGAQANVQAYRKLADLATSGACTWLICKSRDRLGRTRRLNHEVADFLQDHAIRVYSRTLPPASTERRTESDIWGEAIESGYSEAQILRLVQRREMGMQARVRRGKLPNKPPWGFTYVIEPGRLEPVVKFTDPLAEATIRFVITRFHQGISKRRIIREANERNLPYLTNTPWTYCQLNNIIYQPAYYSLVAWGRRRTIVEAGAKRRIYIPLEEWTLAEAAFQGPLTPVDWQRTVREHHRRVEEHPRRRSTPFPLSGIAWCVDCDAPFRGTTVGGYRYYRCGGFRFLGQEYTTSHYIRDFALHRQMGEYLQELAEDPAKLDILLAGEWGEEEDNWEAQQGALLRQQDELLRRRRRWQDAYEAAAINLLDFAERMKKIEKEEAAIERQLQEIEDQQERAQEQEDQESLIHQAIANIPLLLGGELTGEDREILRAMFSRLVHRVLIKDKQVIDMKFKT